MRIDELQRDLASARDDQFAADVVTGRHSVDRRVRRHRVQRAGLAVVIIVLLAGAGVLVASRGTDEQRVISGPNDIPHYLPEPLPAEAVRLLQLPDPDAPVSGGAEGFVGEQVAWTDDPSAFPGAESTVLILTMARHESVTSPPSELEIRASDGNIRTWWTDEAGNVFTLTGVGLDEEHLLATQRSVVIDGAGRVALDVPPRFREVARTTKLGLSAATYGGPIDPDEASYVTLFGDVGIPPPLSVSASQVPRSHAWLTVPLGDREATVVRGKNGYRMALTSTVEHASSDDEVTEEEVTEIGVVLVWWERDDLMMSVTAPSERQAHELAESLREVGEDEWNRFVASSRPFPRPGEQLSPNASSGVGSAAATTTVP